MKKKASHNWQELNKYSLMKALNTLRELLKAKADNPDNPAFTVLDYPIPPTLETISQKFALSPFEQNILLLCAGMELDGEWGSLCARAMGDSEKPYPTFTLALSIFPNAHWNAIIPTAPLRRWRLIELVNSNFLTSSPLWIDERIVHHLTGISHLDERLLGIVEPVNIDTLLVPSHQEIVQQLVQIWLHRQTQKYPVIQLCGIDSLTKQAIATAACQKLGFSLNSLAAEILPADPTNLNLIQCLCEREWLLSQRVLLLDCDYLQTGDAAKEALIGHFIEKINCPLVVNSRERRFQRERPLITLDIFNPSSAEQREIWRTLLQAHSSNLNGQINSLVNHFSLNVPAIQSVSWQFNSLVKEESNLEELTQKLWNICLNQSRPRLEELAQRINSQARWRDLIIPSEEQEVLKEIAAHVRQRSTVYEHWGFENKSSRGLGISALFAGASGTGKTLAAEVLANELHLDVYRIDLSSVVSKYIGETEKNLRKIFDVAEGCGAILLFDEADALFGKRSEVKDSHDRYANMEVSYLLQRIESYRGLAILTTNLKDAIDQAFVRRIRFIVQFPFPDAKQREEIWKTVFPEQTPTEGLNYRKLACLNVPGGNIRNIAMNAAFLAADRGEFVQMKHLLQATRSEYLKMERTLTDAEIKGWL